MKKQRYTSAATSINSAKMPKIYGIIKGTINPEMTVIDYGCGRYFDNYGLPENYFGYDPYNRPDKAVLERHYNVALCSNVLNVVAEWEIRREILETLRELADTVYITVYEGNRSGKGKQTREDCYQLNRRLCDYIPEVVTVFGAGNVKYYKGMLIAQKGA